MLLVVFQDSDTLSEPDFAPFPHEVEFMISALEAGPRPVVDRQKMPRTRYRARALLKLYSDAAEAPAALLYTRHVNRQAIGFVTSRHLTLSHGGMLRILDPQGKPIEIACTVLRCREVTPGWFEGAVYFNRQQAMFDAGELAAIKEPAFLGQAASVA